LSQLFVCDHVSEGHFNVLIEQHEAISGAQSSSALGKRTQTGVGL
jgi:hypothetical protein